MEKTKKETYH